MTKKWSDIFQQPETIDEAVDRLMMVLDDEHKAALAAMREEDLIDLHFSLGVAIYKAFGMYEQGSKLMASCGVVDPDDASGVIIQALWIKLIKGTQWTRTNT